MGVIPVTGASGFFTQLGPQAKAIDEQYTEIATLRARQQSIIAGVPTADYDRISDLISDYDDKIRECKSMVAKIRQRAQAFAIDFIDSYIALTPRSVNNAMTVLINDMRDSGTDTINANNITIGSQVNERANGDANVGDAILIVDEFHPDGYVKEYMPSGIVYAEVTNDRQFGIDGDLIGFRTYSGAYGDPLDEDWPAVGGLGFNTNFYKLLTAFDDSNKRVHHRNILLNANFEDGDNDTPASFVNVSGSAGSEYTRANSGAKGSASLELLASISLGAIKQDFNSPTGTGGQLTPAHRHALACHMERDGTMSAGEIQLSIKSGVGAGSIIDGGAAAITKNQAALSTSWDPFFTVFSAPNPYSCAA